MEDTSLDSQKKTQQEGKSQFNLDIDMGTEKHSDLAIIERKIKRLAKWIKDEQVLTAERCIQQPFHQRQFSRDVTVPKHVRFVSVNEKYLHRCLDFLEIKASDSLAIVSSQAVSSLSCGIAVNLKSSHMRLLFENLRSHGNRLERNELGGLFVQCPSSGGNCEWIALSMEGCKNFTSGVKGPLPYNLGPLDTNMNIGKVAKIGVKGSDSNFASSPSKLSLSSLQKLKSETKHGNENYGLRSWNKGHASIFKLNSLFPYQSTSTATETVSQGMLHLTWKSGVPCFVFSVDNEREVYMANQLKPNAPTYKNIDCVYLFHSKTSNQSGHVISNKGLDLVGKMKVSSSLTLCSENSKVMETEFVLFGSNEKNFGNTSTIDNKCKGSPKKVVDMIRMKRLLKQRLEAKFGGLSSELVDLRDPSQDMSNRLDPVDGGNFLDGSPNLELVSIMVKDQFRGNSCQEKTVGGWGLKFLEKSLSSSADTSIETSFSSDGGSHESCLRNSSECSTSMTVLLPADFHGGPKTRNGGPSGLIERWKSGGHCDCGGWDIGCPLTVLTNKAIEETTPPLSIAPEECKSFDLFREGAKQGVPLVRMMNIHDGLYIVHFHSSLSALQSFSIAVAKIHAQSSVLHSQQNSEIS